MSLKENDIAFESNLEKLREIDGCWYHDVETLEEGLEKSIWCNKNLGRGSRARMARLLEFCECQPSIYNNRNDSGECGCKTVYRNPAGACGAKDCKNKEGRKISDAELDKGDDQYHEEVDNELSFNN